MVDVARQAWRDHVTEQVLEPDLRIIDPHHHLFPVAPRPHLEPCLPDELFALLRESGHNIMATVHVDAFSNYRADGPEHLRVVGETEYIDRVADEAQSRGEGVAGACAAIVGNAELMMGSAVGEILDAHIAASRRFKGVRRMTVSDPDLPGGLPGHWVPQALARPEFHEGMREVIKRGLSFDACVVHSQLGELVVFAQAFPEATIILNHIGTPLGMGRYAQRRTEAFAEWKSGMKELARCKNVVVKIGGLNMPFTGLGVDDAAPRPWTSRQMADRQRDHVLTTIDLFGPARCMFESNFPVDQWYTSYRVLWNSFKLMAQGFGTSERDLLFYGTAQRAYRIDLPRCAKRPMFAAPLI